MAGARLALEHLVFTERVVGALVHQIFESADRSVFLAGREEAGLESGEVIGPELVDHDSQNELGTGRGKSGQGKGRKAKRQPKNESFDHMSRVYPNPCA